MFSNFGVKFDTVANFLKIGIFYQIFNHRFAAIGSQIIEKVFLVGSKG